jgi:uncharacterized protein (TIGR02246 family)
MTTTSADEAAIRRLFDIQGEAWLAGDGDHFATAFAEDADFINITATALRGRAEIARHHDMIFSTVYKGVKMELSDLRVRFLRPDIATVEADARGRVGEEDRQANLLAVVLRNDGERLIHALHSMIPFKAPRP